MPAVVQKQQALEDILEVALYLEAESSEELAYRFLDALDATFAQLAAMPLIGHSLEFESEEAQGVRIWRVSDFEAWLVFYRPTASGIEVIRVLHGARNLPTLLTDTEWR